MEKIDKSLMLKQIKLHLGFKTDAEFADFLGIKPNVLSAWYKRNTFDTYLLHTKCRDISSDWLITGKGEMILKSNGLTNCELDVIGKKSPIKERILYFAETLGISKRDFYKKINVSRGTLESNNGITEDVLVKFITTYPEINIRWLITGEGEMLKNNTRGEYHNTYPPGEIESLKKENEYLKKENRLLERENIDKQRIIDLLDSKTSDINIQINQEEKNVGEDRSLVG